MSEQEEGTGFELMQLIIWAGAVTITAAFVVLLIADIVYEAG